MPELVLSAADLGLLGSGYWRAWAYRNGAFWAGLLGSWQPNYAAQPWLMFVTYAFLHAGLLHLFANLGVLLGFGPAVRRRSGDAGFVFLYAVSAIAGAAAFGLLSDSPRPMVGASGALFGLVGGWLNCALEDRRRAGQPLWPVGAMILGLIVLNALSWVLEEGILAWQTHFGGFVGGWVAMGLLRRLRPVSSPS